MKIVSWNVNGIRSVSRKGSFGVLEDVDFMCIQELKCQEGQLPEELQSKLGPNIFSNCAQKKGYSGVAIFARSAPNRIRLSLGNERFDSEGRYLELEYEDFILINVYMPHGGRQQQNIDYKLESYRLLLGRLDSFKNKKVIVVGDFNIAHQDIDLARPAQNRKNIMFTPAERQQVDSLIARGFTDAFRHLYPEAKEYTWWPWIKSARENNVGWRIDHVFLSLSAIGSLKDVRILRSVSGSDHCPVELVIA